VKTFRVVQFNISVFMRNLTACKYSSHNQPQYTYYEQYNYSHTQIRHKNAIKSLTTYLAN